MRLHLHRIHYHLYYELDGDDVEILALWHTNRGKRPIFVASLHGQSMSSEHGLGDDLRPEYDLTELMRSGIRGKYAARYRAGPVSLQGDSNGESNDPVGQFELTAEQEAKLEAAIAERERGNYVTLEQLFEQLRRDREGTSPPL